jgi:chemotaxis protein CheZ
MAESENQDQLVFRFPASPEVIDQIETLLSLGAPRSVFASQFSQQGNRFDKVLGTIKEFMTALSKGNCVTAQDVLLKLAEQQQAGLYNEIGGLARELHNSLKNFMETMDPHLREMVDEKIPDTGNRLEHILELTENAANTTIDHVEAMQRRNEAEQKRLDELVRIVTKLKAIGDKAQNSVSNGQDILKELQTSVDKNHDDLIVVLTAQDYQDLTGQIILKIIQLLKDLELKLVNVIRTFGVKAEEKKATKVEELYGPAHKAKTEALHSQDDVDSLLAEFGF